MFIFVPVFLYYIKLEEGFNDARFNPRRSFLLLQCAACTTPVDFRQRHLLHLLLHSTFSEHAGSACLGPQG